MSESLIPSSPRLLDSAWRALAYCLHPRVIWLSLLPLVLSAVSLTLLASWGWSDANVAMREALDNWAISQRLLAWLDSMGWQSLRSVLVPMLLLLLIVPLVVVLCLLMVAAFVTPAAVRLVRARRFEGLETRHSEPVWRSLVWSAGATLMALGAMVISLPLWFVPFFALVGPPLIWGWLTYRVMAYDTLADVATPEERKALMSGHRTPLLLMGVVCGYLGAAPAALWAFGVLAIALAPLVLVVSVWLYTLVFVFSSLWFAHYLLAALHDWRRASSHPFESPLP
jgi:hypothetical protein